MRAFDIVKLYFIMATGFTLAAGAKEDAAIVMLHMADGNVVEMVELSETPQWAKALLAADAVTRELS